MDNFDQSFNEELLQIILKRLPQNMSGDYFPHNITQDTRQHNTETKPTKEITGKL